MGSPLGPTLANIFLGYHEKRWLDNCPLTFKPVLYRRYIDDTFLLFRHESHIQNFLNYLNSQHQSIEFTCETENNCRLNFLDITIHRNTKFETSVFRKDSFTNLGMKFNSFIPNLYKNNLISCLIFRAFRISSNESFFARELDFLILFFQKNSFPHQVVQKLFKKTLQNIYNPKPLCSTVERKLIFINLPYLGKDSFIIKKNVKLLISRFYPQVKPIFCFRTSFTIGSLFRVKDRIPLDLMSSVVYLYSCGQCASSYVGQTSKQLIVRVSQHKGCSFRTDNPLVTLKKVIF